MLVVQRQFQNQNLTNSSFELHSDSVLNLVLIQLSPFSDYHRFYSLIQPGKQHVLTNTLP